MTAPVNRRPAAPTQRRFTDYLPESGDRLKVLHFFLTPRRRWIISWIIALASAAFVVQQAWQCSDDKLRLDGNGGHASIDFGGQWLMGRTLVLGQGRHLYQRNYLRPIARQSYPEGFESPEADKSDAEALMSWLTGTDDEEAPRVVGSLLSPLAGSNILDETTLLAAGTTAWTEERLAHITAPRIGGALYPPVHALLYAPLALMPPRVAYRIVQGLVLCSVLFAGWIAQRLTEGRVWMPVATVFAMMIPGFAGCIGLGQNGTFSMTIVLLGWWQFMRGREWLAGLCWGLLAFKPVWAIAFLFVPLLIGRWRMAAGMIGTGLGLIIMTLPLVGWEAWRDWLQVGLTAAQEYRRQENWIILSRDLLSIPRRWLLTFEDHVAKDLVWRSGDSALAENNAGNPWDHPLLSGLGWGLWMATAATTLFVIWRCGRRHRETIGIFPAFVLIGCFFSCYHFLYYDFAIAAVPLLLLFAQPRPYYRAIAGVWGKLVSKPPASEPKSDRGVNFGDLVPPLLLFLIIVVPAFCCIWDKTFHFPPFDTFGLLLLWGWCGYRLLAENLRLAT
jgi:arabinofuranan 3-O-arabinosyltransferase